MRFLFAVISLGLSFLPLLTPAAAAAGSSVYWGATLTGAPFDMSAVSTFESHAGKRMSITSWGQAWTSGGQFQSFQTAAFNNARGAGLLPLLTWGSWDTSGEIASAPNYQLADIIGGRYDAGISMWATQAKAWGHPFFLRFDWEMNGWWYPWSEQVNGNSAGQFVTMWRHVHDIFTRVGANNVTWVWCPNIVGPKSTPMTEMYPGDSYVDWTCFDGYNWGTVKGGWQTFDQIMTGSAAITGGHNTYQELSATSSKPMMIAETGAVESGGNKAAWLADMLANLPTKYPKVKALVYTNAVEQGVNWPIESSSSAEAAFRNGIQSAAYTTNTYGNISGKIPAPGSSSPVTAPAPPPTTPVSSGSSATFTASADTYTSSAAPRTVEGASRTLRADRVGTDTTYMRFDLSSLAGRTITSAKLRVHTTGDSWSGSTAIFDVNVVTTDQWTESMTFANAVAVSGTRLGTLSGPTSPNTAYSIGLDLNALKSAGNWVSLAIRARTSDVMLMDSRESGSATAPVLAITYQ